MTPAPGVKPAYETRPFWQALPLRLYHEIEDDRLLALGAGVVFYGLLALFPAITAFVSSYALFADVSTIAGHLSLIEGVIPTGAFGIVRDQVIRVVTASHGGLSLAVVAGFGFSLWSANAGLKAMIDALNIIYDVKETRSFIRLNLVSLAMTAGTLAMALLAIATVVVFPLTLAYFGWSMTESLRTLLRWPVLLVAVLFALAILYRFGPDRRGARFRWITPGSAFAAATWFLSSAALSWYLANVANYDATYGSLGAAIGLMMWLWISSIVVLIGAEIDTELGAMRSAAQKSGADVAASAPMSELEARPGIEPG